MSADKMYTVVFKILYNMLKYRKKICRMLIMYLVNWDFRDLMYFIWEVKVKEINYLDCWCLFVTSVPWPLKLWSLFVLKLNIMTMFGINPLLVSSSNAYQINVFNVGDQYYKTRNKPELFKKSQIFILKGCAKKFKSNFFSIIYSFYFYLYWVGKKCIFSFS